MTGLKELSFRDVSDGNYESYEKTYGEICVIISRHKSNKEWLLSVKYISEYGIDGDIVLHENVTIDWVRTFDRLLNDKNDY